MSAVLTDELTDALAQLATRETLLVCLDFDGCVAELVADALAARPVPANAEAINTIAALDGVTVAYVSGRPLETLRELSSPPPGTLLVGSHGAERDLGNDDPGLELTGKQQLARTRIIEVLEEVAAPVEGSWVEHKPAGAAIHVRSIEDPEISEKVLEEARAALSTVDGAHLKEGKEILEAVVVLATKGEGIQALREHVRPDAVFFAGDDVTDEQGFAVLGEGDVGVKVGPGDTLAGYRIPAPADLADVLNTLARARQDT